MGENLANEQFSSDGITISSNYADFHAPLTFGFIITRHINSETTSKYWIECYECIRKFYDDKIIIIDDNSCPEFVNEYPTVNCEIISSKFPQRGELLGYYYFYSLHPFDKAVIMHDSVFIQQHIDFNSHEEFCFLWDFKHTWNSPENEITLLHNMLSNDKTTIFYKLLMFYLDKNNQWKGCYGVQSVISHVFLDKLVQKYSILKLLDYINTREQRMTFERIFGLLCSYEQNTNNKSITDYSIFGDIHDYTYRLTRNNKTYDYQYHEYLQDKENNLVQHFPIVKVWTGR
jgi:hypothetical protein